MEVVSKIIKYWLPTFLISLGIFLISISAFKLIFINNSIKPTSTDTVFIIKLNKECMENALKIQHELAEGCKDIDEETLKLWATDCTRNRIERALTKDNIKYISVTKQSE